MRVPLCIHLALSFIMCLPPCRSLELMKKVKAWDYLSSMPEIPGRDDLANAIITSLDYNVYVQFHSATRLCLLRKAHALFPLERAKVRVRASRAVCSPSSSRLTAELFGASLARLCAMYGSGVLIVG